MMDMEAAPSGQPLATVAELRSQIKPETLQTVLEGGFGFLRRSSLVLLGLVALDAIFVIVTMALAPYPVGLVLLFAVFAVLIGVAAGVVGYRASGMDKDLEKRETRSWMKYHAVMGILTLLFALFASLGTGGYIALVYTLHNGDTTSLILAIILIICNLLIFIYSCRVICLAYARRSGSRYDQWGRNNRGIDFFGVPLRREWDPTS